MLRALSKIPLNLLEDGLKIVEFAGLSVVGTVKHRLEPILGVMAHT
jgi:hypothetical protein